MTEKDKKRKRDQYTPNAEENQESEEETQEQNEQKEEPYFRPVDIPGDEEQPEPEETSTGFVMVDRDTESEDQPLKEEETEDFLVIDTNEDLVMEDIDDHTTDETITEDFEERQRLTSGSEELADKLRQHHSKKPDLSGGDVDASWEDMDVAGEEGVGGTVPTPDQDVVDELGDAYGLSYDSEEPLNTEEKFLERDRNRWELDPASAEQYEEEEAEEEEEVEESEE